MPVSPFREYKIAGSKADGQHVYLNENGAFLGQGSSLLERDADGSWIPRPRNLLEPLFAKVYGVETNLQWRMGGLASVAVAMNKGDINLARPRLYCVNFRSCRMRRLPAHSNIRLSSRARRPAARTEASGSARMLAKRQASHQAKL